MKVLCIYNKYDNLSLNALKKIEKELAIDVKNITFTEWNEILNDLIPIHALPAVIFIREDLQGHSILQEEAGSERLTLEAAKMLEEEERYLQNFESNRLDTKLKNEIKKASKRLGEELVKNRINNRKMELRMSELLERRDEVRQ